MATFAGVCDPSLLNMQPLTAPHSPVRHVLAPDVPPGPGQLGSRERAERSAYMYRVRFYTSTRLRVHASTSSRLCASAPLRLHMATSAAHRRGPPQMTQGTGLLFCSSLLPLRKGNWSCEDFRLQLLFFSPLAAISLGRTILEALLSAVLSASKIRSLSTAARNVLLVDFILVVFFLYLFAIPCHPLLRGSSDVETP